MDDIIDDARSEKRPRLTVDFLDLWDCGDAQQAGYDGVDEQEARGTISSSVQGPGSRLSLMQASCDGAAGSVAYPPGFTPWLEDDKNVKGTLSSSVQGPGSRISLRQASCDGAAGSVAYPPGFTPGYPPGLEDDKNVRGTLSSSVQRPESGLPLLQTDLNGASGRVASPPWREDDKDGHFQFDLGENITPRYTIVRKMGQGTYGQVLECWDREVQECVAIKVSRNAKEFRDAAITETVVLLTLANHDKCLQLKDWFDFHNHVCIVCERLGPSLYASMRKNNFRPFRVDLVREFGRQLLESLAHLHELTLIHTDLKPDSILLVSAEYVEKPHIHELPLVHTDLKLGNTLLLPSEDVKQLKHNSEPKFSEIKIIDFGCATYDTKGLRFVVSTRQYRAPEIVLGLGWTYPCDLWSVGCILSELCSGDLLFPTHAEDLEHLVVMERRLGPVPQSMKLRAGLGEEKLDWPRGAVSQETILAVRRLLPLRNLIMQHADHSAGLLIDLLYRLLKFEPSERMTAKEALEHPFFRESSRGL